MTKCSGFRLEDALVSCLSLFLSRLDGWQFYVNTAYKRSPTCPENRVEEYINYVALYYLLLGLLKRSSGGKTFRDSMRNP